MRQPKWQMAMVLVAMAVAAVLPLAGCGSKKPAAHATLAAGARGGHPHGDTAAPATAGQVGAAVRAALHPPALRAGAGTVSVPAAPTGPSSPSGGWHVALGDGFAAPIGTGAGQDPFWFAKSNSHGCCGNSNETNSEQPSAVHWSLEGGLELRCEGLVCGGVSTPAFTYELGRGVRIVIEYDQKLPGPAPGEDPGAWSISTTRWPPELDTPEWWDWCSSSPSCSGGFVYHSTAGQREVYFNPYSLLGSSAFTAFHKYTTEVEGSTVRAWIDGKSVGSFTETANTDTMNLILTHALRVSTQPRSTCQCVRYVTVYEPASQAGQAIHNGGLAPGTVVGGEQPPPPPPPPTETTETTPPPPPPPPSEEAPKTPVGCTATGGAAGVTVSCQPSSGATSYLLWRTGPWPSWVGAGAAWASSSSPSFVNHAELAAGRRYCYWLAAKNAKGQSADTGAVCVKT